MLSAAAALLLTGCGHTVYDLPENAPELEEVTYLNEKNKEDGYEAILYGGREYVPYGTIGKMLSDSDVKACVGYTDGDKNERVCTLAGTDDYIMTKYVGGFMDQPVFYRAADTVGEEIYTPGYIMSLDYELWDDAAAEERK